MTLHVEACLRIRDVSNAMTQRLKNYSNAVHADLLVPAQQLLEVANTNISRINTHATPDVHRPPPTRTFAGM